MLWHGAAELSLAAAALFEAAQGQVVTITEYASVCSAVYTTGSRSVTVVQSTVMFEPLPASANATQSTSVATNFYVNSRSAGTPGGYTATGGSGGNAGNPSSPASASNVAAPSTSSSSSGLVSRNGLCGANNGGWTCLGSGFGDCCSAYGNCGSSDAYCGTGCQSAFGTCEGSPASSAAAGSNGGSTPQTMSQGGSGGPGGTGTTMSSMSMPISMSMGGMTSSVPAAMSSTMSSPASSASPLTTVSCPANNGSLVQDSNGAEYTLGCGSDTSSSMTYSSEGPADSLQQCVDRCDADSTCTAFAYDAGANGVGAGDCYIKDGSYTSVSGPSGSNTVSGSQVRAAPKGYGGASSMGVSPTSTGTLPTFTTAGQPIGPINPGSPSMNASSTLTGTMPTFTTAGQPIGPMNPGYPSMTDTMSTSSSPSTSYAIGLSVPSSSSMNMAMTSSNAPSSIPTQPVSPNGHCGTQDNGGTLDGFTCTGSDFGMCCSSSGFCGNSTDYCVAGCQTAFGSCTRQTGNPITSSGWCGTSYDNQTCTGGEYGPCCSVYGTCGSTSDYCGTGNCNPMFGTCNGGSPLTMAMSSTAIASSIASSMPNPTSSSMMASTTSAPVAPGYGSPVSSSSMMASTSSAPAAPGYGSPGSSTSSANAMASSTASSSSSMMPSSTYSSTMVSSFMSSSMMPAMSSSSSSSLRASTTSTPVALGYGGPVSSSSSSSSMVATPTAACPAADGQIITDGYGVQYIIGCGKDITAGSYSTFQAPSSFDDCFDMCSSDHSNGVCSGFTYQGGVNGVGQAACYAKNSTTESFTAGNSVRVAAIRLDHYNAAGNQVSFSSARSTSSTSSAMNYATTSTTTTTTSSVMSTSSNPSSSPTTMTSSTVSSWSSTSSPAMTTTTTSASSSRSSSIMSSTTTYTYLVLPSPTRCDFGDTADSDEDDSYCNIALPSAMQIYAQQDTTAYASTNGYISILSGSSQYQAMALPDAHIPNHTVAPFFDDLYLVADSNPQQGIFYQYNSALSNFTFEYYLGRNGTNQTYHFTVDYSFSTPGVFVYTYYQTGGAGDYGTYASVGTQGINAAGKEVGFQYSLNQPDEMPGLVVTCNTALNTCVTTKAGSAGGATGYS